MENENYMIDRNQISINNENIALERYDELVKNSSGSNISFLNKNYEFIKIRNRKTEINISTLLSIMWNRIGVLSGLKNQNNHEIAQDITNLIFSYHSELTLEEIYKAFELERFNIYDTKTEHYQLFNAEYVATVLKKYKNWKLQMKTIHKIEPIKEIVMLPEKTSSEIKETMSNAIVRKFNIYKELKEIEIPFVYVFDELTQRGIIKTPTNNTPKLLKYYEKTLERAKSMALAEVKNQSSDKFSDKVSIKTQIKEIESGNIDKAKILVKKIILTDFFKKHISENTDFESFIKQ